MDEIEKMNILLNVNPALRKFIKNLDLTVTEGGEVLDIDRLFNNNIKQSKMSKFSKKPAPAKPTAAKADEKQEMIFAQGITVFSPREGAPDYVKGSVIISLETFVDWCEKNEQYLTTHGTFGTQLKLELKQSQGGMLYFQVNTYKPGK
jgi:hypothetical protein